MAPHKASINIRAPDAGSSTGMSARAAPFKSPNSSTAGSPRPPAAQEALAGGLTSGVQHAVHAAVFVPKTGSASSPSTAPSIASRSQTPDFRPDPTAMGFRMPAQSNYGAVHEGLHGPEQHQNGDMSLPLASRGPLQHNFHDFQHASSPFAGPSSQPYDPMTMDPAFFSNSSRDTSHFSRQPLHYHLYAPPLPHVSAHHPHQIALHNFFLSYGLREELQRKMEAVMQGLSHGEGMDVGGYFGVHPMDTPSDRPPKEINGQAVPGIGFFGYRSWLYKAASERDGKCYALRRLEGELWRCFIDGYRLTHEPALQMVEKWRRLRHPNIVGVREAFTTRAFGDNSLVFVFDFHPLSNTLMDVHLAPKPSQMRTNGRMPPPPTPLNERVFWSYVAQIASAIRAAHTAGLAVRTIEASKILVTGKNRLRINCCSIFDVVRHDETAVPNLQQEDLFDFGKLLVSLACGSVAAIHNLPRSLEHIGRQYSPDVQKTILALFGKPSPTKTIEEVLRIVGGRILDEFNASQNHDDSLEAELMREVENGRLVRLLCKFGFINERPEFDHDPKWSESGERYVIKLFRDFVFHQVDERGRPLLDLSHVLTCLNKLDAGVDERISLVSRDAQTCLVVSYKEIRAAVDAAYRALNSGSNG